MRCFYRSQSLIIGQRVRSPVDRKLLCQFSKTNVTFVLSMVAIFRLQGSRRAEFWPMACLMKRIAPPHLLPRTFLLITITAHMFAITLFDSKQVTLRNAHQRICQLPREIVHSDIHMHMPTSHTPRSALLSNGTQSNQISAIIDTVLPNEGRPQVTARASDRERMPRSQCE